MKQNNISHPNIWSPILSLLEANYQAYCKVSFETIIQKASTTTRGITFLATKRLSSHKRFDKQWTIFFKFDLFSPSYVQNVCPLPPS
jgi:hypothetical protein